MSPHHWHWHENSSWVRLHGGSPRPFAAFVLRRVRRASQGFHGVMTYPEGSYNAFNEGDEVGYYTMELFGDFSALHGSIGGLEASSCSCSLVSCSRWKSLLWILCLFYRYPLWPPAVMSCLLSCSFTLFWPIEVLDFLVLLHHHGWIDSILQRRIFKEGSSGREVDRTLFCPCVPPVLNPFTDWGESFRSLESICVQNLRLVLASHCWRLGLWIPWTP